VGRQFGDGLMPFQGLPWDRATEGPTEAERWEESKRRGRGRSDRPRLLSPLGVWTGSEGTRNVEQVTTQTYFAAGGHEGGGRGGTKCEPIAPVLLKHGSVPQDEERSEHRSKGS